MIESIHLKRFKNFQDATLKLGPLTILIGANAAGKSNLRDAFLFLHGIGRGYTLAEIFGENYVGGERVWSGTRGGVREVAYLGSDSFELSRETAAPSGKPRASTSRVPRSRSPWPERLAKAPRVVHESLQLPASFWQEHPSQGSRPDFEPNVPEVSRERRNLTCVVLPRREGAGRKGSREPTPPRCPILFQVAEDTEGNGREARALSRFVLHELRGFRFLDLSPAQMRIPSQPGQTVLGDQGENLSSVLFATLCGCLQEAGPPGVGPQAHPDGRG